MNQIFLLKSCTNIIPNYNSFIPLASSYFGSNRFCSNVHTHYFCPLLIKVKNRRDDKKEYYILYMIFRVGGRRYAPGKEVGSGSDREVLLLKRDIYGGH